MTHRDHGPSVSIGEGTFFVGPGRLYIAPMPPSRPPTRLQRAERWLRWFFNRPKRLSRRWVDLGYTDAGAQLTPANLDVIFKEPRS